MVVFVGYCGTRECAGYLRDSVGPARRSHFQRQGAVVGDMANYHRIFSFRGRIRSFVAYARAVDSFHVRDYGVLFLEMFYVYVRVGSELRVRIRDRASQRVNNPYVRLVSENSEGEFTRIRVAVIRVRIRVFTGLVTDFGLCAFVHGNSYVRVLVEESAIPVRTCKVGRVFPVSGRDYRLDVRITPWGELSSDGFVVCRALQFRVYVNDSPRVRFTSVQAAGSFESEYASHVSFGQACHGSSLQGPFTSVDTAIFVTSANVRTRCTGGFLLRSNVSNYFVRHFVRRFFF